MCCSIEAKKLSKKSKGESFEYSEYRCEGWRVSKHSFHVLENRSAFDVLQQHYEEHIEELLFHFEVDT